MNQLLHTYPSGKLHVILDNVKSHDSKEVKEWHKQPRHKRVVFHFIPTYSSWLNLVEVLFNLLQSKTLRRGVFTSKPDLVSAIKDYLEKFNEEGRVFRWTKSADKLKARAISIAPAPLIMSANQTMIPSAAPISLKTLTAPGLPLPSWRISTPRLAREIRYAEAMEPRR